MVSRWHAVRILTRVLSDQVALDEALAAITAEVSPEQRGWLQEVCSGTLRWKGRLDWILDSAALKKKPSGWLRKVLLLAAYQLIAQDRTSAAAVVNETVSEVRKREGRAPSKFANALLRKISEHATEWRNLKLTPQMKSKDAAAWASLPEWLWSMLVMQHGREWAESFAQAGLERPKLWVSAKSSEWTPSWGLKGPVPGSWESVQKGAVQGREGFNDGQFIVQDISSQLLIHEVSEIVSSRLSLPASEKPQALDLCAAPGGKAVGLSWKGFQVYATDVNERRMVLLQDTVKRVAPEIAVVSFGEVEKLGAMDLVWVDAPCSGIGIIRRHPDVRWLRRENDLVSLQKLQQEVLLQGWQAVKPGGFLVYSVCSVLKQEGPEAIQRAGLAEAIQKQWLLAPQIEPFGDGFWAALLFKTPGAK
ncbi:MAG TPA: hypothetical protein DCS07_13420 [Bdellovibrionales bacterium]|nr:MAG: hypothetical protein A2Z97_09620 [Bdellovibrionales bacterium GWB1_52_6]OFZ03653.1 MAG: hypothetical protein A2X97_00995 [Bdellovibrionales bacterium GWA1_52_35]OFZ41344.1 MAG: hypothetical protein A2070_08965 [Bdellovibrionales bacterium GWC1_52_8]HAR43607.1 hypothetical protein [Bdellovibrionales bacterium]HCM40622.1 hypothetical protein [Bdellovibrionales bacterium]